jgi:hypothetical protein
VFDDPAQAQRVAVLASIGSRGVAGDADPCSRSGGRLDWSTRMLLIDA